MYIHEAINAAGVRKEGGKMEVKSNFCNEEAMQKKQPNTVLINGYELPTYQKHWKDRVKIEKKVSILQAISILQGLASLVLAAALLWE